MPALHVSESDFQSWRRSRKLGPQLASLPPEERAKKPSKWKNKRVFYDGYWFDSLAERNRYCELRLLEKGGLISQIEVHKIFTFQFNGFRLWTYESDFTYINCKTREYIVEDVKNPANAKSRDFVHNCLMMKACFGIEVKVVMNGKG